MRRSMSRLFTWGSECSPNKDVLRDDPLTLRLQEVDDFEAVLRSVEAYCNEMQSALARLDEAPGPMMNHLAKYSTEHPATCDDVKSLALLLSAGSRRLRSSEIRIGDLLQRIRATIDKCASIREASFTRKGAWATKLRCEAEVQALHRRVGPRFTMEEKSSRLKANHEAGLAFKQNTEDLAQLLSDVIEQRWTESLGPMLAELCRIQAVLFDSSEHSRDEFHKLTNSHLASHGGVTSQEDLVALARCPYGETFGDVVEFESIIKAQEHTPSTAAPLAPTAVAEVHQLLADAQIEVRLHRSLSRSSGEEEFSNVVEPFGTLANVRSLPTVKSVPTFTPIMSATAPATDSLLPTLLHARFQQAATEKASEKLIFENGETVEVWSGSKSSWLAGLVEEVFLDGGEDEGWTVPVGVVKVSSSAGVKYIRPGQFGTTLRKAAGKGSTF